MSFITQTDFERVITCPIGLPQSELQSGESLLVTSVEVPSGRCLDLSWLTLHVPRITPTVRTSRLIYAAQVGNQITASDDFFTEKDVGAIIKWDTGEFATIASYSSETVVYATTNQSVNAAYFEVIGGSPQLVNSYCGAVYSGVYSEQAVLVSLPTGNPIYYLSLDAPGVVSLPARSRRIFNGPDIVSVVVTNNTYNVSQVEVVLTGVFKLLP